MFRKINSLLVVGFLCVISARADSQYIVRVNGGAAAMQLLCSLLGCSVSQGLDGGKGQLFLVSSPSSTFLQTLLSLTDIVVDAEPNLTANVSDSATIPSALSDTTPINYFGQTVPNGYVNQPATQIIRLAETQKAFDVKGAGIVAVIDTGIDPNHPTLTHSLVPGYDFTRNQDGEADETLDLVLPTTPSSNPGQAAWVNSNDAAAVDQSTAAVVDGNPAYSDFGHGTMVAGVIHVVAPGAKLMPLKAFLANGTGATSDIIRAIYWAVQHNANILNMSFSLAAYSQEVKNAIDYAASLGVISVAASGNQGQEITVYPAAFNNVMGVASTSNTDQRSSFSNYGSDVWLGAPGEGVITTYPFSTYAAAWGTSFSTPFVSGVAALILNYQNNLFARVFYPQNQPDTSRALGHAYPVGPTLGHGRLDAYQALTAWSSIVNQW